MSDWMKAVCQTATATLKKQDPQLLRLSPAELECERIVALPIRVQRVAARNQNLLGKADEIGAEL